MKLFPKYSSSPSKPGLRTRLIIMIRRIHGSDLYPSSLVLMTKDIQRAFNQVLDSIIIILFFLRHFSFLSFCNNHNVASLRLQLLYVRREGEKCECNPEQNRADQRTDGFISFFLSFFQYYVPSPPRPRVSARLGCRMRLNVATTFGGPSLRFVTNVYNVWTEVRLSCMFKCIFKLVLRI